MEQALVDLIGLEDGSERDFDEWRQAAQSAGLQPNKIQNLKRRGLVWTRITPEGQHLIVRGSRPTSTPE